MTCTSCQRALQVAAHAAYREGCLGCSVRRLAHMGSEDRARQLDRIQFACGWAARVEVVKLLEIEAARIKSLRLRSESARKEKA